MKSWCLCKGSGISISSIACFLSKTILIQLCYYIIYLCLTILKFSLVMKLHLAPKLPDYTAEMCFMHNPCSLVAFTSLIILKLFTNIAKLCINSLMYCISHSSQSSFSKHQASIPITQVPRGNCVSNCVSNCVHAKTWQFLGYRLDQPHGMFLQSETTCVNYMVYHAFLKLMHSGYILGELKEQTSHCFNVVCMCFILFISVSIALIECNRFSEGW